MRRRSEDMVFKKKVDIEAIARTIYDPSNIGAASVIDALDDDFRIRLLEQLKSGPFKPAEPFYNNTVQDFSRFSSETLPLSELPPSLEAICELARAHQQIYQSLIDIAAFDLAIQFEYSAHYYAPKSVGLGSHRDESKYRNLIAVYVISGERDFLVGKQRDLSHCVPIENPPGSLIFMRAPRDESEKNLRPFHARAGPNNECYTLSFRHTK